MDEARTERARRRAAWPGVLTTLDDDRHDAGIVRHGTPEERLAMLHRVTLDAWASARLPLPRYTRATMPGRLLRAHDDG